MKKIIIAAMDENRVIGKDGKIPWHHPEDMRHFKEVTTGNTVLMGRKTYESLPEDYRPLPNRENIVLTRSDPDIDETVKKAKDLDEAYEKAENTKVFIAGGASIYEQTLKDADRMILTRVPGTHEGDTFFPEWDESEWTLDSKREEKGLTFQELTRNN